MSNSGPAPRWNRNSGSGCHRSGPGLCISASAVCGTPIAPSAISRRAVCSPAPSTVSGAQPSRRPARPASASRRCPVAVSRASGFSVQTLLPAASAAEVTSACAAGMVRLTTSSTSGSRSAWATVPAPGTPYLAACSLARSRSMSAQKSTRRSGNDVRLRRYSRLMVPQPTTATPTGPAAAVISRHSRVRPAGPVPGRPARPGCPRPRSSCPSRSDRARPRASARTGSRPGSRPPASARRRPRS